MRVRAALGGALALACIASTPLEAQCPADRDSGRIITDVVIRRGNVFDTTETNSWWHRLGNNLHRVTRPHVIRRELLLDACLPYDSARAAETERNLRALGTFRKVDVDTVSAPGGVVLRVTTSDGWSTRPEFGFSSTGDQSTFTVGITEENFLGHAIVAGFRYSSDPDRRTTSLRFTQRRTFGDFGVQLAGDNRTDGWNASIAVTRPFFAFESRSAVGALVAGSDGDVRRYRGGLREPELILARRLGLAQVYAGRALSASPSAFWRVGGTVQVTSDAYAPAGIASERATVANVELWTELSRSRYIEVEQYRSMGRAEDIDLSPRLHAGFLLAPRALGYERDGVGVSLRSGMGVPLGGGFLAATAEANGLFSGAGVDSGRVAVDATILLRPGTHVSVLLHGQTGWQERPAPGEEYDLGFSRGLRAHRTHAFSGDRVELVAGEVRWTALRELFGVVHLGVAALGAHGGAWWSGDRRRTGSELGGGLRVAPSRLADATIGRIDLMWRFATDREPGGWTIVFGEGLTF